MTNKILSGHNFNINRNKKSSDKCNKNAGHSGRYKNKRINNNDSINISSNININDNNNNCKSTKKKVAITSTYKIYNVKVGERQFCLTADSLRRDEPNFFTAAFFGYFSESNTSHIFIERDPTYFNMIVRYLRGYDVDWPTDKTSLSNLLADVKFYGFEKLQLLLEEIYEKNYPKDPAPWKIFTYAFEENPVVAINIKDIERERWEARSLIYNINPISKKTLVNDNDDDENNDNENNENIENNENDENNENNDENDENNDNDDENDENNDNNDNNDNNNVNNNNATAIENDNTINNDVIKEPDPEKGLYRLEIHGGNAMATVISNHTNGIKFENFTLKNSEEEENFRTLTEAFRTPEGSLTLSPSLKLPFLNDSCIEIDGSKYYSHKALSGYFGVTDKTKLYFEEIVIRIVDAPFLMRARAWTTPHYYASQPIVQTTQH